MAKLKWTVAAGMLMALATTAEASIFGDIVRQLTGIEVNIPQGTVTVQSPEPQKLPQTIADAIQRAPEIAGEIARGVLNPAGEALAFAIRQAEGQARFGARPIPPQIREDLAEFFPADLLDWVQFNTLDQARLDLANLVLLHPRPQQPSSSNSIWGVR